MCIRDSLSAKTENQKETRDKWAEMLPLDHLERREWVLQQDSECQVVATRIVLAGNLLLTRGTQAQYQETHKFYAGKIQDQHLEEVRGRSEWVAAAIRGMCQSVTRYHSAWDQLEKEWPLDLDLAQLWLVGCSDLSGDQLLILQGERPQLLAATKGLVPARTIQGRESLVVANSIAQKLQPLEAAMLIPGAMREDCLLWLES